MRQDNLVSNRRRLIIPIFLSGLIYTLLLFMIKLKIGYISVRLAYTDMYIPIYYWLIFIAATYLYSFCCKIKFLSLFRNMAVLGIFVHIYVMLIELNQFLLIKPDYARMYLHYAFAIETGLFALSGYFLCRRFLLNKLSLCTVDIYLYFPLATNIFYHLYRDIRYLSLLYFGFHLIILAALYFLHKKWFYFGIFKKERIASFIKSEKNVVIIIFLFSLFARAIFAFHILHLTADKFPTASDDGPTYNDNGILIMQNIANLISGKKILPSTYDPGYSIFLGLIYKIFGHSFYAATLAQSALNALMVVVVYLIARQIFNRRIGAVAAVLAAVNQPLIMLSVVLTTEALYIPLLVFSIYCLMKFSKNIDLKKSNYYLFLGGLFMGLAIITRAMLLLFPGLVILWLLLYRKWFKWIRASLVFLVGLLPALFLITILTYTNTGELKCFTNKQDPNWIAFTEKEGSTYIDPRHVYSNAKLIEMGISPFHDLRGSILIILKNPLKVLKIESEILPIRLKLFLFYPNFGYFDPIFILTSTTPNQYASTLVFYAMIILLTGIMNAIIKKGTAEKMSLVILIIIYYLIIHVGLTTGQCARYRVPIDPFFIIFAANGLYLFYKNVISRCTYFDENK